LGTGDVAPASPAQVSKDAGFFAPGLATGGQSAVRTTLACRASLGLRTGFPLRLAPLALSVAAPALRPSFYIAPDYRVSDSQVALASQVTLAHRLSRPSQSDSRVTAHDARVVGNGCHTASSTRTSPGVPALQGFTPSTLHLRFYTHSPRLASDAGFRRCSLLTLDSTFAVPACASSARLESSSQGLNRWAS